MVATFCFSLVCYAWLRKYTKSTFLSLAIVFVLSTLFACIILKVNFNSSNKLVQSNKDAIFQKQCFEYLSLNKSKCKHFFVGLLDIIKTSGNFFFDGKKVYYINYEDEQLSSKDICKIKNKNYKDVIILSHQLTNPAKIACESFGYKTLTKTEVFLLMKQKKSFPTEPTKTAKGILESLKNFAKNIFNKKKAKHYLLYGVLLLGISFIVPFTFLYCVFGTISIVFGLVCFMKNPKESTSV